MILVEKKSNHKKNPTLKTTTQQTDEFECHRKVEIKKGRIPGSRRNIQRCILDQFQALKTEPLVAPGSRSAEGDTWCAPAVAHYQEQQRKENCLCQRGCRCP